MGWVVERYGAGGGDVWSRSLRGMVERYGEVVERYREVVERYGAGGGEQIVERCRMWWRVGDEWWRSRNGWWRERVR